jgi:hypothetical protein
MGATIVGNTIHWRVPYDGYSNYFFHSLDVVETSLRGGLILG